MTLPRISDSEARAAFAAAREICRRANREFYLACMLLPRSRRDDVFAVFAFCRMVREALLQTQPLQGAQALRQHPAIALSQAASGSQCGSSDAQAILQMFRQRLDDIYDGRLELPALPGRSIQQHALHAFSLVVQRYQIPRRHFLDLAESCRIEQSVSRWPTWASLERYLSLSGGALAQAITSVLGVQHSDVPEYARKMGVAMQFTSILCDLRVHLNAGRLPLPLEDLARFRCSERSLLAGEMSEAFKELMKFQIDRTRLIYREAAEGICWLGSESARLTVSVIAAVHAAHLNEIERRGFDIFSTPVRLRAPQKLSRLRRAWRLARRRCDQHLPDVFN